MFFLFFYEFYDSNSSKLYAFKFNQRGQEIDFIRCSGDRRALADLITNDENYQSMEEDTYEVITQYVKAEELIQVKDEYRKDGKVDMYQALKELIEEGREEGRDLAIRDVVVKMIKKGKSDEEIMELTECGSTLLGEIRNSMEK